MTTTTMCPGAGRGLGETVASRPRPAPGNGTKMLAALAALLLTTTPALAQKPLPNPFSDKLATLKDIPRRAVLRRAVLDNNRWCDRVIDDRRQGTWRNLSMWTVRCGRGAEYGVFIGPDQSVQVNPCADMAKSKLPACQLPPRRK